MDFFCQTTTICDIYISLIENDLVNYDELKQQDFADLWLKIKDMDPVAATPETSIRYRDHNNSNSPNKTGRNGK